MKRYGDRQIRRTLSKYNTRQVRRPLAAGCDLQMTEVGDVNVLLDSMIEREGRLQGVDRFPYWAELWPTALAMAQWFCHAEEPIPRGWACELGCGLGLVGIALAKLGWRVEATDFVEDALIFAAHNAQLNRAQHNHRVAYLDWRNPVGEPHECLVGSDIIYEKKNHRYLERILRKLLLPGGRFYLGDPQRKDAGDFVSQLVAQGYSQRRETRVETWNSVEHQVAIYVFTKPQAASNALK